MLLLEQSAQKQEFVKESNSQNLPVSSGTEFDSHVSKKEGMGILETLLKLEFASAYVPNQLTKKAVKKKKRISNRL